MGTFSKQIILFFILIVLFACNSPEVSLDKTNYKIFVKNGEFNYMLVKIKSPTDSLIYFCHLVCKSNTSYINLKNWNENFILSNNEKHIPNNLILSNKKYEIITHGSKNHDRTPITFFFETDISGKIK